MVEKLVVIKQILGAKYAVNVDEESLINELESGFPGEETQILFNLLDESNSDRFTEDFTYAPKEIELTFDDDTVLTFSKDAVSLK